MKRVKIFTHTDLDGAGCEIVIRNYFKEDADISVEYCTYDSYADINKRFESFIGNKEYEQYDIIFITDISVNLAIADLINDTIADKCVLLDHHPTVMELNNYDWATVTPTYSHGGKACGTSLVCDYLHKTKFVRSELMDFVETVRRYDTWEWKTKYNDDIPKKLNDLFRIYGRDNFVEMHTHRLDCADKYPDGRGNSYTMFGEVDKLLLDLEQKKIDKYVFKKQKQMRYAKHIESGYDIGVVFAEEYISELGNRLAEDNRGVDFVAIISMPYTVSFRGIRDDIDLGEFAKKYFGGGGHPQSAGCSISQDCVEKFTNMIL